ncbi:hypothetical protein QWY84_11125 [Aquisalimonas lutea]|uniref:hypothetical protein n=1 Tax=Aquisalimonas lutea TaxID=1327750 RepID=UPI0025B51143|nr:hypothetical protein [Aquisalimonas lutea]MDN3518163.1 hypothetical protein [Aquisalimonas lutea]
MFTRKVHGGALRKQHSKARQRNEWLWSAGWERAGEGKFTLERDGYVFTIHPMLERGRMAHRVTYRCPECGELHRPRGRWDSGGAAMQAVTDALARGRWRCLRGPQARSRP